MLSASINANGYSTIDYCNQNSLPSPPHYSDTTLELKNINQNVLVYDANTNSDDRISNGLSTKQMVVPNTYTKKIVIDMNNKINEITVLNSPIELSQNQNVIISTSPTQYIHSVNSYSPEIPINTNGNNVVTVEPYPSPCINYTPLQDSNNSPLLKDDIVYTTVTNNTNNQIMVISNPNTNTFTTVTTYPNTLASSSPNSNIITNINENQTQNANINLVNNYNFEVNNSNSQSTTLLPSQSLQQTNSYANEKFIVNPTTFVDKNEYMALDPSLNNVNNITLVKPVQANAISNIQNQTMNQMQPTNTTYINSPSQSENEKLIIPPNTTVVINSTRPMVFSPNVSNPNLLVSPENSVTSENSYISDVNATLGGNHEIIITNANLNEPSPASSPYKVMTKSISDPLMYCMSDNSLSDMSIYSEGPNNLNFFSHEPNANGNQLPNNTLLFNNASNVNQNVTYLNSNQVLVSDNISIMNGQLSQTKFDLRNIIGDNKAYGISEGNSGVTGRYIQRVTESNTSDDEIFDFDSGIGGKKRILDYELTTDESLSDSDASKNTKRSKLLRAENEGIDLLESSNNSPVQPKYLPLKRNKSTKYSKESGEPYDPECECDVCHKIFSRKYDLIRHRRIHTGDTPYKCQVCGAGFTRSDHRDRHIRRTSCGQSKFYQDLLEKTKAEKAKKLEIKKQKEEKKRKEEKRSKSDE